MALTAVTGSGTQNTTQTPQPSASSTGVAGGTPSTIQPGTNSASLFNSSTSKGVALQNPNLTTVNVAASSTQTATAGLAKPHHTNPALFGFSIGLFIVAVALFYYTGRSAKNTTKK